MIDIVHQVVGMKYEEAFSRLVGMGLSTRVVLVGVMPHYYDRSPVNNRILLSLDDDGRVVDAVRG